MPGPGPDLSHDEHFLIRNFRSLRGEQRRAVADIVGDLARAELARAEPRTRGQLCGPPDRGRGQAALEAIRELHPGLDP